MSEHRFIIKSGVPGVYNLLRCEYCGITFRISPEDVICGSYLPRGNIEAMAKKQKCSRALQSKPPEDMLPAYEELFKIYKKTNYLRDFIPNCPAGAWPHMDIGTWGTPRINLWDRWFIGIDISEVAIFRQPIDRMSNHYRIRIYPDGAHAIVCGEEIFKHLPDDLIGWEQFRELALIMYRLPAPNNTNTRWFGRPFELKLFSIQTDEDIEKLQKLLLKMSLLYDIYRNNKGGFTIKFTCQKCGKTIEVQPQVWRIYDGQRFCLSCRDEVK